MSAKIFAASLLPLLILIEVAGWSLNAMNRLVRTNRTIVSRALPARRETAVAGELVGVMARSYSRWVVLRDPDYEARWRDAAVGLGAAFERLDGSVITPEEQRQLRKATSTFERYRDQVAERGDGELRLHPVSVAGGPDALRYTERMRRSLGELGVAIDTTARRAQEHAAAIEERTWRTVLLALPGSALLAIVLSFVVSLRATRALRRVSTASRLLAQGRPTEPIASGRHDEIGDLARAFDAMAARLGELDRLKEQVFSHLAHEIRTPLTSVREAAHLLADGVGGPLAPRQERLVGIIGDSADRLLRLLNRVLDLSRLRAGLLPLEQRPVRVAAVAARALHELRPQADTSKIRMEHPNGGPDPWVLGDEERLVEVVVNLLSNALKASSEGGVVRVTVGAHDGVAELRVQDWGIGIPAETRAYIFDPYVQGPNAPAGSGLGLAIVKSILEAHRGAIEVESEPGQGSCFIVTLPRIEEAVT